jgi:ABC-type cobalamin/Fe3+-siderophores transport system ATPase subunit
MKECLKNACALEDFKNQFSEVPAEDISKLLSEAQRVKILIARALLRKPKVLLLENVLDALEEDEAIKVLENIKTAFPDILIVLTTDRLTIAEAADKIYLLEDRGKLVELKKEFYYQHDYYAVLSAQEVKSIKYPIEGPIMKISTAEKEKALSYESLISEAVRETTNFSKKEILGLVLQALVGMSSTLAVLLIAT